MIRMVISKEASETIEEMTERISSTSEQAKSQIEDFLRRNEASPTSFVPTLEKIFSDFEVKLRRILKETEEDLWKQFDGCTLYVNPG